MKRYDFLIVGAGIIGLTVALELKRRRAGASVALLEKEPSLGVHASGRNSGVLHAGIYYGADTLKAKACSSGSRAMMDYATERGIKLLKCGKVIVATREDSIGQIDLLLERARANSIRAERLDSKALAWIEPHARSLGDAIFSPDTAVIDSMGVLRELKSDISRAGIDLFAGAEVVTIKPAPRSVDTKAGAFSYGHLINTAGAYADRIAHIFDVGTDYTLVPFKGLYYKLSPEKNDWVRGNIYPAPDLDRPFLGVHLTRSIDGEVYLGPTAMPALGRENYRGTEGIDLAEFPAIFSSLTKMYIRNEQNFRGLVHSELSKYSRNKFLEELQCMVPGLEDRDLLNSEKAGIRPQLVNTATWALEMDFIIEDGPSSTHVLNAISPAFTSAFSFAEMVADRVPGMRSEVKSS